MNEWTLLLITISIRNINNHEIREVLLLDLYLFVSLYLQLMVSRIVFYRRIVEWMNERLC